MRTSQGTALRARRRDSRAPCARGVQRVLRAVHTVAALAVTVGGCGDVGHQQVTAPMPTAPTRIDASVVTGAAAAAVNDRGEFTLPAPDGDGRAVLSVGEAKARAEAWARQFGSFHRTRLESGHGAPIDFATLVACPRAFFARSPYEPPRADAPNYARNLYGPRWLVSLCASSGVPQVSLAIAAWSTDVELTDGRIRFPRYHGNEFVSTAIPRGLEVPLAPERAARLAAEATGRRVAGVPELVLPPALYVPQFARWRVALEAAASFRTDKGGQVTASAELFVGPEVRGPREALLLGRAAGAAEERRQIRMPRATTRDPVRREELVVRWRAGWPADFARVTVDSTTR